MNIKRCLLLALAVGAFAASARAAVPDSIRLSDVYGGGYQLIVASAPSGEMKISLVDSRGQSVGASTHTVTVSFTAVSYTGGGMTSVPFTLSTNNFTTQTTTLTIPSGAVESAPFRFKTPSTGNVRLQARADNFYGTTFSRFYEFYMDVLPAGTGFSNVSIRTDSQAGPDADNQITITPDRDGTDEAAVMSCRPPNDASWEVLVATSSDFAASAIVRRFFGFGGGEVFWYGEEGQNYRTVPNGVYHVRLQTPGGGIVHGTTMQVTVLTSFLKGRVTDGANPLSDVAVNVYGPGGGGYALTGADGKFFIGGLKNGQSHTVALSKGGYASKNLQGKVAGTGSAADLGDIVLPAGVDLVVRAARGMSAGANDDPEIWGNLNVRTLDYRESVFANVHFAVESSTSDNGFWAGDISYATFTKVGVTPGTTYFLELYLNNYGRFTRTIVSPPSGSLDVLFASTEIVKKTNITGQVHIATSSASSYFGTWVSVDGRRAPDTFATVYGGGFIDVGQTSATYTLYGLDPGTWTLTAYAQGLKSQSISTVVVSNDLTINFPAFQEGGAISGVVTVMGDSRNVDSDFNNGFATPSGTFGVNVNAWSPQSFQGAWTTVFLATSSTQTAGGYALKGLDDGVYELYAFLPGFQLTPPGAKRVTVAGGVGALNLDFQALSGRIDIAALLPSGDTATLVTYDVQGQGSEGSVRKRGALGPASTAAVTGLGTGLYRVSVQNGNTDRGLRKEAAIAVTNGQTAALTVDLREQTFAVSGVVSFESSVQLSTNGTVVNISSASGLRDYVSPAPMVEVFDFPLPENFYGNVPALQSAMATVTPGASTATFRVTGLPAGSYLFRVKNDLDPPSNFNGPASMALPEFGTTNEVVFVGTGDVSGLSLKISNGVELSGTVSRPAEETTFDARTFLLTLRRSDNLSVLQSTISSTGATASYAFQHLSPGDYLLELREDSFGGPATVLPKYAAEPARVSIGQVNVALNFTLKKAGAIVGKLRDADSGTLITSQNVSSFLPTNFQGFAKANPWVSGGYAQAETDYSNGGGIVRISTTTGQFAVYRLVPGTAYDLTFRNSQGGLDLQSVARGQKAYAPFTKSGVKITEGQTVDVGTIDLTQGVTIKGAVTNAAGTPLSNIRVQAYPSVSNGGDRWEQGVEAFTGADGKFTLQGVDRSKNYYDVTAAPRFDAGDVFGQLSGVKYGEVTLRMVDVNDVAKREGANFALVAADGVLNGRVVTADGAGLEDPFSESDFAAKRGRVFLHREGAAMGDDPLGEIETYTDAQGYFSVDTLVPGSYVLRAASLGYVTAKKTIVVRSGSNNAGTITLETGATVSGTLTKPDGTSPSLADIRDVVGVDADFSEFIFGRLDSNDDTQLVTGYKLSGFKTGLSYSIMAMSEGDDILELKSGLTFASSTETKTLNLVYRAAGPAVFVTQSRSGSQVSLSFFSTHKLRNLTDTDNDLGQIVTLASGNGVIVSSAIGAARDTIAVTYQLPANEASFRVRVRFTSAQVDPDDAEGDNFTVDQTFEFFAGAGRSRRVRVANATGGSAVLEGDPSGATFGSGTFSGDGFELENSSRIEVGVVSATDLSVVTGAPQGPGPKNRALGVAAAARALGPAAYPVQSLYKAVQLAPSVSPFSAFYDIFLPAGVSHSLKKEAFLTLKYDDSITDPSSLNVYYFDEGNGVFLLEGKKRSIDAENKTITVAVDHFSTFVVLQNNQAIVGANTYAGVDFAVYNFPNPFNLKTKTVALADPGAATASQTIDGTLIKCALPAGKSGAIKIEIYTMTGDLVRTLAQDGAAGGAYYYLPWDGKNEGGKKVASGVYVGRFTLNNGDEKFFKMAVVK